MLICSPGIARSRLRRHRHDDPRSLSSNQVRGILEDDQGYVWIGTVGGGLNRFDPATGEFKAYMPDPENAQALSSAVVTWLDQDHSGALWVGTWGGGLNRFEPESETFVRYRYDENEPASLGDNRVHDLLMDDTGTLWVALVGRGLDRFDPESETFVHYPSQASTSGSAINLTVLNIYQDHNDTIWLGTTAGLYRLDRDSGAFHLYTEKEGMPTHIVRCIQEDDATPPNLWLGTNNGLYRFDPRAGSSRQYDVRDGLQDTSFIHSACEKSSTGECSGYRILDIIHTCILIGHCIYLWVRVSNLVTLFVSNIFWIYTCYLQLFWFVTPKWYSPWNITN